MELVIKVPEEEYNRLKFIIEMGMGTVIDEIVANGTPLPKGHGKIGDLDALRNEMHRGVYFLGTSFSCFDSIKKVLEKAPILIPADKEDQK